MMEDTVESPIMEYTIATEYPATTGFTMVHHIMATSQVEAIAIARSLHRHQVFEYTEHLIGAIVQKVEEP